VIRAVVFDFDGVIANSEPLHFRAFAETLAEERVILAEHDYYGRYLGYDETRLRISSNVRLYGSKRSSGTHPYSFPARTPPSAGSQPRCHWRSLLALCVRKFTACWTAPA
jgi:hypothetical protein